jgi:hypothetical protein
MLPLSPWWTGGRGRLTARYGSVMMKPFAAGLARPQSGYPLRITGPRTIDNPFGFTNAWLSEILLILL